MVSAKIIDNLGCVVSEADDDGADDNDLADIVVAILIIPIVACINLFVIVSSIITVTRTQTVICVIIIAITNADNKLNVGLPHSA